MVGLKVKGDGTPEPHVLEAERHGIQETWGSVPDFLLDLGEGA